MVAGYTSASGLELGDYLSVHHHAGDLALPFLRNWIPGPQMEVWDMDERVAPAIAVYLVTRACVRERICTGVSKPLNMQADNGITMCAVTLEGWLE